MSRSDDDEQSIDDASLKSMRAVWLSMRDEEPPAAGMSALMAAAAQKADQMRDVPSWWQRLFAQLRRPPALAFATVMLLIGGAVLVTRSAHEKVDALTEDPPAVNTQPELQSREALDKDRGSAAPTTGIAPADPVPQEEPKEAETPKVGRSKDAPKPRPKPPKVEEVGKNEPDRFNRFESDVDVKPGFAEGRGGDSTVLETPSTPSGQAPKVSKPPPEPPVVKKSSVDSADEASRDSPPPPVTAPPVTAAPVSNEQLAKQAESLATKGDCAAVREIVAQLRRNDEAFYKKRLGKNAAVAKCL